MLEVILAILGISDPLPLLEGIIKIIKKISQCIHIGNLVLYLCTSFGGDWNCADPKKVKKVQKRALLNPWFVLESHSKVLNPPFTWTHKSGISILNFLMIQLTLLNWLFMKLGKVWIFWAFSTTTKKYFCENIKWCHTFLHFSRNNNFLLWPGTVASFGCSLTCFNFIWSL